MKIFLCNQCSIYGLLDSDLYVTHYIFLWIIATANHWQYNVRQALTKVSTDIDEEVEDSDSGLLDWESEDDFVQFADRSNANENDSEHDDTASLP